MKKNRVIIFGGAFNPPTKAHIEILQASINYAETVGAEVWLLPSGNRKDKTIPTSKETRLDLLDAMVKDVDIRQVKVRVELLELERIKPVETYDTVQELTTLYPEYEQTWVFGADSTTTMPDWNNGHWLVNNLDMIIINRTGSQVNPFILNYKVVDIPTPDISSTLLRHKIDCGEDFLDLVTPYVNLVISRMLVIQR